MPTGLATFLIWHFENDLSQATCDENIVKINL